LVNSGKEEWSGVSLLQDMMSNAIIVNVKNTLGFGGKVNRDTYS